MAIEFFRPNLRAAMRAHPMKMYDICKKAGYSYAYVRKVLAGRSNPTLLFAECMAVALDKTLIELLERQGDGVDTN